ncbi:MAG: hypothetical protein HY558_06085 [Euryarchaeota archaeon]|nr:hypothetical protein [Euryarchaeota archaeon]
MGGSLSPRDKEKVVHREFLRDLSTGVDYVRARAGHMFQGPLGSLLNPLSGFFFNHVEQRAVQRRLHAQVQVLFEVARSPEEKLERVVKQRLADYLEADELYLRVNPRHPKAPRVRRVLEDIYTSRVTFLYNLLRSDGSSYEELIRNCYPNRRGIELLLGTQYKYVDTLLEMMGEEPELVRLPGALREQVLHLLRDAYRFARDHLNHRLDEIYGAPRIVVAGRGRR